MNVKTSKDGKMEMDLHDKEGVEITNKSFSLKKLKNSNTSLQYGSFLKSATLLANVGTEKAIEGHVSTQDIEIKPIQVLSDADLFKACNGRTAHKGARHGLNLTGKLQRIAEQEKLLLEKMKNKINKHEVFREDVVKKHKINESDVLNTSKEEESSDNQLPIVTESDYMLKSSKKRQKRDRAAELKLVKKIERFGLEAEVISEPATEHKEEEPYNGTPVRKKKKSKHSHKLDSIFEADRSSDDQRIKKKDKRKRQEDPSGQTVYSKKKKSEDRANIFEVLQEVSLSEPCEERGKKGKRKFVDEDDEMIEAVSQPEVKKKKVKLDSSYDASAGEDEESVIDRINKETRKMSKSKKISKTAKKKEKHLLKKLAAL